MVNLNYLPGKLNFIKTLIAKVAWVISFVEVIVLASMLKSVYKQTEQTRLMQILHFYV